MKTLSKLLFVFTLVLWGLNTANAQNSLQDDQALKAGEVKDIVNSKKFVLKVEHIKPITGTGYQLKISPDSLVAYLPDLEKTRLRPADTLSNSSTQFTCTNFAYNINTEPDGHWVITISPKQPDVTGIRQLKLNINQLGYTSLNINTGRGPVTYSGYIKQVGY